MNLLDLAVKITCDDQASAGVSALAERVKGGLAGAASAGAAAISGGVAAVASGVVAMGGMAANAYSDYEQLSGGMAKLFGDAYGTVMDNAQSAYATMGMSANDYMQGITGLSGALRHSIGDDSEAVANAADMAMGDIADNASVYGTDIETITEGYMSLSRGNVEMLDTVTQGYYAGTKEGLQQLIDDANAYEVEQGRAGDLVADNYADVVQALHDYQEQMGITGNASQEAFTSMSGSLDMLKASWANWLIELGKDDADMGARTQELFNSVVAVAQNFVPRIEQIANTLITAIPGMLSSASTTLVPALMSMAGTLVETVTQILGMIRSALMSVTPQAAQDMVAQVMSVVGPLAQAIINTLPSILSAAMSVLTGIIEWLAANAQSIVDAVVSVVGRLANMLVEHGPELLAAAASLFMNVASAVVQDLPEIVATVIDLLSTLVQTIVDHAPDVLAGALQLFLMIVQAIAESIPEILSGVAGMLASIVSGIVSGVGMLLDAGLQIIGGLLSGVTQGADGVVSFVAGIPGRILGALGDLGGLLWNAGSSIINGLLDGIKSAFEGVKSFVGGIAGWIAEHKGPLDYDARLLIPNGAAIMESLATGIEGAFEGRVQPLVSGLAGRVADAAGAVSVPVTVAARAQLATVAAGGAGSSVTNVTIGGITYNDDDRVGQLMVELLAELRRRGEMA